MITAVLGMITAVAAAYAVLLLPGISRERDARRGR